MNSFKSNFKFFKTIFLSRHNVIVKSIGIPCFHTTNIHFPVTTKHLKWIPMKGQDAIVRVFLIILSDYT